MVLNIAFLIVTFIFGLLSGIPIILRVFRVGSLVIDETDPEKDRYSFEIETGLNSLSESNYIVLKVKKVKEPQNIQPV